MFAADAKFQVFLGPCGLLHRDLHELADADLIERLERIFF